jgi:uncharacterized protein
VKKIRSLYKFSLLLFSFFLLSACATYYQKLAEFNEDFETGNLEKAKIFLEKDKKGPNGKAKLIYNLNRGTVESLLGNYSESNTYFNQADLLIEDFQKSAGNTALALVTNPMALVYQGEDFEKVLIHYYKAINYLQLNQSDEALVEAKRLNLKLDQLNDKYTKKNRYSVDAFGLNLIGIIYQSTGDYNNAFISYRNAVEAYEKSYEPQFGISIPEQLKKDIIYTAYKTGFDEQVDIYEKKFGMKYEPSNPANGDLVFFWNNGLGPVKGENSINFNIVRGQGGYVTFVNSELGMSFPFPLPATGDGSGESGLSQLEFVRVAFPKYVERPPYYSSASISAGNKTYPLDEAEDINKIAFKTLEDRMLRELGNSLLRLATKKAAEYAMRDQNKEMGAVVGIVNAFTEKADTRNWQTLPYSISYTRISLPEGKQQVDLKTRSSDNRNERSFPFTFDIKKGKTVFHTYQTMESVSYR